MKVIYWKNGDRFFVVLPCSGVSGRAVARNLDFTLERSLWLACLQVIIGSVLKALCGKPGHVESVR